MAIEFPPLESLLGGETLSVEYKTDLDTSNRGVPMGAGTLAGSLMAIGNAQGGFLLLGVNNKGGMLGVHAERKDRPAKLRDEIKRKFIAPPEIEAHLYRTSNGEVWAFHITPAAQNPYQLTDGSVKIRRLTGKKQGPENLPFFLGELQSWQAERGTHFDFSSATQRD
jgi:predicted HTH transcriptional regulator